MAAILGFLASLYFQWRVPQPQASDVSRLLPTDASAPAQMVELQAQITQAPRLTRSQKMQLELHAIAATVDSANQANSQSQVVTESVTGRVYATVPLLQGTGLQPGQHVTIAGSLYKPKPASNPGGFDFAQYLARQGIFAGLNGKTVEVLADARSLPPLRWLIRQRMMRSQVTGAGVPEGPLISAMVMGKQAVDVPYDIQDQFKQAGLAHTLAASGTQVSMLLAVVLVLTRRLSARMQLLIGLGVLASYVGLTGIEPSVLRAGVMGAVALVALSADRRVKPLGSLLLAATLLLLLNPLWIWDLGFQLSFLATLGLLVTVPPLTKWLDWLPTAIAPLIAVPIAAYLWTTPLLLGIFGTISLYSVVINILTSPLILIISIGGMISALAALVYPLAGSALAGLLFYPAHLLIQIAAWGNHLPGSSFAVGRISVVQVLLLYGLIGLVWGWTRLHRYWWMALGVGVCLVAVPALYLSTTVVQATVLATAGDPVLVLQDRGKVGLINSGTDADTRFSVLPFLQQQGINQIDWAIAPDLADASAWQRILNGLSIQRFYSNLRATEVNQSGEAYSHQTLLSKVQERHGTVLPMLDRQTLQLGSATIKLVSLSPVMIYLSIGNQTWLLLSHLPPVSQQMAAIGDLLAPAQVLWWSGDALSREVVETINPKVAIASSRAVIPDVAAWFQAHSVTLYRTGSDGAIQWTPQHQFSTTVSLPDNPQLEPQRDESDQ